VKPGSVAERIGLAADDIVTKINQRDIENAADMERALAGMVTGMRISVTFIRGDVLKKGETSV
jgi:S1-C subfamily serine protease